MLSVDRNKVTSQDENVLNEFYQFYKLISAFDAQQDHLLEIRLSKIKEGYLQFIKIILNGSQPENSHGYNTIKIPLHTRLNVLFKEKFFDKQMDSQVVSKIIDDISQNGVFLKSLIHVVDSDDFITSLTEIAETNNHTLSRNFSVPLMMNSGGISISQPTVSRLTPIQKTLADIKSEAIEYLIKQQWRLATDVYMRGLILLEQSEQSRQYEPTFEADFKRNMAAAHANAGLAAVDSDHSFKAMIYFSNAIKISESIKKIHRNSEDMRDLTNYKKYLSNVIQTYATVQKNENATEDYINFLKMYVETLDSRLEYCIYDLTPIRMLIEAICSYVDSSMVYEQNEKVLENIRYAVAINSKALKVYDQQEEKKSELVLRKLLIVNLKNVAQKTFQTNPTGAAKLFAEALVELFNVSDDALKYEFQILQEEIETIFFETKFSIAELMAAFKFVENYLPVRRSDLVESRYLNFLASIAIVVVEKKDTLQAKLVESINELSTIYSFHSRCFFGSQWLRFLNDLKNKLKMKDGNYLEDIKSLKNALISFFTEKTTTKQELMSKCVEQIDGLVKIAECQKKHPALISSLSQSSMGSCQQLPTSPIRPVL